MENSAIAILRKLNTLFAAHDDDQAIRLACEQWKGTTSDGVDVILKAINEFHNKYGDVNFFFQPEIYLRKLTFGFPEEGQQIIQDWLCDVFTNFSKVTPQEFIKRFLKDIHPILKAHSIFRKHIPQVDTDAVKLKFLAITKQCPADFWDIKSQSEMDAEIRAHQATETMRLEKLSSKGSKKRKLPLASEYVARKFARALRNHPEKCPNCLFEHDLVDCKDLDRNDARNNLAAYIVPDYFKKVKGRRFKHLIECAVKAQQ